MVFMNARQERIRDLILSKDFKAKARLLIRFFLGVWRQYPVRPWTGSPVLDEHDRKTTHDYSWTEVKVPIPTRGDAKTRRNRIQNLEKAVSILNGISIPPGATFSLYQHLGEPSLEHGYAVGPAFIAGRISSSAGGGLCLIATSLYGLFLKNGLTIVERHNHSIDAYGSERFYELGEDAAISYGAKDLVVRNPFPTRIQIILKLTNGYIVGRINAHFERPVSIIVRSHILEKLEGDSQFSKPGWIVMTSRFSKHRKQGRWKQDYKSLSTYHPC
jgi:vancomycin resistance protein VanW